MEFVYIGHMKAKSLLILKAAKALILVRIKAAGDWTFYASPATCLYGPHGGVSYWGEYHTLEQVCKQFGLQFVQYCNGADSARVLETAKKLAARYERFYDFVHQWKQIDTINFADNSVEAIQQDRAGNIRQVMILRPGGDVSF